MEDVREQLSEKQKKKLKKMDKMLIWGLKHKKVFPYPNALFDLLRPYSVAGFPASIMLFITEMCNGFCYDRAVLMSLAFKNCEIIHANIETLRITAGDEFAEHAYVRTTAFGGGKKWIVDTSVGLIFEESFYNKMEKPTVNQVFSKEEVMEFRDVKEIIASDFETDKYALPLVLPFIESAIKNSDWLGTVGYREKTLLELELFKKAVGYDAIKKEVEDDVRLMRTDPRKLDEKFQIVRDKNGREISRGGVLNPYYVSQEDAAKQDAYFQSILGDEEKLSEYMNDVVKKSIERWEAEYEELSEISARRIEQILANPTSNFYETPSTPTQLEN